MSGSLLENTLALLATTDAPKAEIARHANVGFEWLKKLEAGAIEEPGVRRIQRLHDYLATRRSAVRSERRA